MPDGWQERVTEVAERHVGPDRVPGMVVLVAKDDELHVEVLGSLSSGGAPVARDSLFRITSMTKPVTAAATLAVAGEGLLSLDEPVSRLLPELAQRRVLVSADGPLDETVAAQREITTRDLLTFTFGFGMALEMFAAPQPWPVVAACDELGLSTLGPPTPQGPPEPDTWIARLGGLPLLAQPGERWLYNTGAAVLGVLLSRACGDSFGNVLRTRLFEPLGMRDTAFWASDTSRLATAYMRSGDDLVVADEPGGAWSRAPTFEDGAAGLVSTADDMHAFAQMLLDGGGDVLQTADVDAMCSDQLTPEQKARGGLGRDFFAEQSWGFCQAIEDDGAFGWSGGFGTSWLVEPATRTVAIVMGQRMFESPDPPAVHREIQDVALDA